mgnify:CR=1 FL=1
MQRLSNNRFLKFSDEECITAYQWSKSEGRLTREYVYNFIHNYWYDWFPDLSSYQAFCRRKNNLVKVFLALTKLWSLILCANFEKSVQYIVGSRPIILAKQARAGSTEAVQEYCDKGYNASRK